MASRKNERPPDGGGAEREGASAQTSAVAESERARCVQFYVEQLHRYVRRAAACVDDPDRDDEFLWHVRRGLECLFAAVLEHNRIAATDGNGALHSLETLRIEAYRTAREAMLSDANYQSLADLLQKNANRGVHAESFQQGMSSARASSSSGRLRSNGFTVARTPFVLLVSWLHHYLRKSASAIEPHLAVIERGARANAAPKPTHNLPWLIGAAIVGASGVSFLLGAFLWRQPTPQPSRELAPVPTNVFAPDPTLVADASSRTTAPSLTAQPDVIASGQCPEGTERVETPALLVHKPLGRDGSPWSSFVDGRIAPRRACIERALVTRGDYVRCVEDGGCESIDAAFRNNRACRNAPLDHPLRCVSAAQAAAYCTWRHRAADGRTVGRLSSVEDWESLRAADRSLAMRLSAIRDDVPDESDERQGEWVGDEVPPRIWRRRAHAAMGALHMWRRGGVLETQAPNAWHSWHTRGPSEPPYERIGFRCAVDLVE